MSHFRVENARFRILKGGKIGLSLSIALASSLILYPVDGNATDYFTDVNVNLQDKTVTEAITGNGYSLIVQQATNSGSKNQNVPNTSAITDDVIINPISWAKESYNNPIFKPEINDIDNPSNNKPDRFEVTKTQNNDLNLTLTFGTDANANNISKSTDDVTFYSVEDGTTGIKKASDVITGTTLNLNQDSSKDYTTTIVMSGANTIAGAVTLGAQDSIKLNGTDIVFSGTVVAGDVIVNSNGANATFKNKLTVENGLKYELDGAVNLEGGLIGDVIGSNSVGTLNLSGSSAQEIEGSIGAIGNLNISTGNNATVTGDINATNTDITTNSTLNILDGKTIISTIKSSDKSGNLKLLGSGTVDGTVGDSENSLNSVNVGADGSTSTFTKNVFSENITSIGVGTTEFQDVVNTNSLNVNSGNMTFKDTLNATNTTIGSGSLDLENGADLSGTTVNFTADGNLKLSDGSNITVTNITGNNGKIDIAGNSTISGDIGDIGAGTNKISEINIKGASGKTVELKDNINATTTKINGATVNFNTVSGNTNTNIVFSGNGTANLNQGITGDINFAGNSATVNVENGDITGSVSGTAGTLNMKGSSLNPQTITGSVGNIEDFNIKSGITTVNGDINATNTIISSNLELRGNIDSNISGAVSNSGTLTMNGSSNQTIRGTLGNIANLYIDNGTKKVTSYTDIDAINTDISSTLELDNSKNISSNITGTGNLFLKGDNVVSNVVNMTGDVISYGDVTFESTLSAGNLEINSGTTTAKGNVTATNTKIGSGSLDLENGADLSGTTVNFTANGDLNLSDGSDITVTNGITSNSGNSGKINIAGNSTITGDIGTSTDKISEININGASGKTVNLKDNVYSETTKIYEATVNFNKNSGDTNTNLVFTGDGTANLYANLTGSIDFNESNATVNVSHDKSIIGSVNSNSNSGVINFKGAGNIGESIDVNDTGNIVLGTLNVNTTNKDEDGNILPSQELYIHRDVYADRINLQNNATLVLKDGVNLTDTDVASSVLLTTDANGTGKVVFQGTSIVEGQIGEQSSNLDKIVVEGASGKTVEFKNEIFTNSLEYAGASEIVLNETLNGNVDFNNNAGTLSLADGLNLNTDDTRFIQESNATLNFKGESIVTGVLGGNTLGKTKFDTIKAGNDGKEVIFENKVYANNLEVNNGTVTLKDHLYSSLEFTDDGIVNIEDKKIIEGDITNNNYAEGTLNFKGEAIINKDIADASNILKAVNIATEITRDIVQDLEHNIYAKDTTIGNITNNNNIELNFNRDDITFGGNLTVNKNAKLNILDKKVNVSDKLALNDNSVLSYKILDNSAGIIFADSLDMRDNAQFEIDYNYSNSSFLKDEYTLVSTQDGIKINGVEDNNYKIYEKDGMIKDNSIIDSIIEINNKNLVLKADRTSAGEHKAEDLYIVKSGIGNDYSNGASQSLAGYANGNNREGALGDIIRDLEYIEDGLTITAEKQAQMIEIQRKLAPKANNATVQSAMNVSKVSNEMVSSRIADIRRGIFEDRFEYAVDNSPTFTGYSSGDDYYYDVGDSTLWIKASYTKATQDAVKSYDGYKTKSYGATAGIDKIVGDDVIFGISASYFDTNVTQSRGNDTTKSYRGTIYGSSEFGLAYVDANVSFAHHETDSSREANSGNLSSKIKAQELSARVETGLNLPIDDGSYITPYVAAQHTIYKQKAYQEKGTKYQNDALKVDAVELNTTSAEVGAKLTGRIELENALIIPHLSASITNNFNQKNKDVKAQFVGGGTKFSTPHQDLHKTIYSVGTGFEARITNNSSIILDATYDRSKDGKYRAYGANISFGYSF